MSAVSSLGRPHRLPTVSPRATTSLTSSTLSGSVTASPQALGTLPANLGLSGGVMKQIEQAVTSALQTSKPTDDPRKVIQNAIASVLKKNRNAPQTDNDGDTDASDSDGARRTFNQTLQAYGISPQEFRAQLLAAVHQSGGGHSSLSSFPQGIMLDTAA